MYPSRPVAFMKLSVNSCYFDPNQAASTVETLGISCQSRSTAGEDAPPSYCRYRKIPLIRFPTPDNKPSSARRTCCLMLPRWIVHRPLGTLSSGLRYSV